MRFKKESKVEVLSRKDVPSGSWRCAEIICRSGHKYMVRYDGYVGTGDEMLLERISRKAIRPCPPPPEVAESWVLGDVVEVFNNFSWKMATISKVLGKNFFMVRLLGSSLEFKVGKSDIRTRQSWQDDKWVVIGKGSGYCEGRKIGENLTLKNIQNSRNKMKGKKTMADVHLKDKCSLVMNGEKISDSHIAISTTLKRKTYGHSPIEAYDGAAPKFRAIEKEGRRHQVLAINQYPVPEQVDLAAFPRELLDEEKFHYQTQFSEMDAERRKPIGDVGCSFTIGLESNDVDSVICSVGSCSIASKNSFKLQHHASFSEDIDDDCNDAESFFQWGYEEGNGFFRAKDDLAAEIHRLELHAYRCTIEALHASGPLSWEKEEMVTNLRLSLHISNDEHLMEGQSKRLSHQFEMLKDDVGVCYLLFG